MSSIIFHKHNGISWNSGTICEKANPEKAKQIQREIVETTLTGSYSNPSKIANSNLYRKKPVTVEAFQFTYDTQLNWPQWFKDANKKSHVTLCNKKNLHIQTLKGWIKINEGDFIIKGIENEIYPCKSDIFIQTYELVENVRN